MVDSATQKSRATRIILFVATFVCPPLPIFLVEGITRHLFISLLFTVFGFHFLGIAYTLYYLWPQLTSDILVHPDIESGAVLGSAADNSDDPQAGAIAYTETANHYSKLSPAIDTTTPDLKASSSTDLPPTYEETVRDTTPLMTTGDHKVQR